MEKDTPFLAFGYMFKDNKFWTKYLVLFVLTFLAMLPSLIKDHAEQLSMNHASLLIFAAIGFVVNVLFYGYLAAGIKSLSEQSGNYILPFFNFSKHGIIGLKCFVGTLLFGIAIGIPLTALFIICLVILKAGNALPLILFIILSYLALGLLFPAFFRMFSMTQEILAFFKLKSIFKSVFSNIKRYLAYIGIFILSLIIFLGIIAFLSYVIQSAEQFKYDLLICLLTAVVGTYFNMVLMFITAKCINNDAERN